MIIPLPIGTLLSKRYTIGKVLGQGGFGITYKGADQYLKRVVAIKELFPEGCTRAPDGKTVIVPPRLSRDFPLFKRKFIQEAQLLAKINHPSIVKVFDYFEENNTCYMVMEFLEGITLEDYIQNKGGKLSEKEALDIFKKICEGVKVIHNHGIIHRDLKPENIILTKDGRVVLIDFGAAKDLAGQTKTTTSSYLILTPGYGAPEQYSTQTKKGPYTDIYALGAILYRMLTGVIPPSANERMVSIQTKDSDVLKKPSEINPSISSYLEKVILKALNLNIHHRYQSVDELLQYLTSPTQKKFSSNLEELLKNNTPSKNWLDITSSKNNTPSKNWLDITSSKNNTPSKNWLDITFKKSKKNLWNLVVRSGEKVVLENGEYEVYGDIKVEPGGELIIRNAELKFSEDGGIVVKDATFIAEDSKFLPKNKEWKNITLIGDIRGHIKGCLFEGGRGRKGEFYFKLGRLGLFWINSTYGGCLFVYSHNEEFLIKETTFRNCSANYGGGVYADENNQIENCKFNNCSANYGGGVYVNENNQIENCKFDNCSANYGGGVEAFENNQIENCKFDNCSANYNGGGVEAFENNQIENCKFDNCSANYGGGVYVNENNQIENCKFDNCSANEKGGGVYCLSSNNTLRYNRFINCKPNNVNDKCEKKSVSGGCYITTATLKALNKCDDNCYELNRFRWYRDNILSKEPDGLQLIEDYYKTAPLIVKAINQLPNAREIYSLIWHRYLKPCLENIEKGNYQRVKDIYTSMVLYLKNRFLKG